MVDYSFDSGVPWKFILVTALVGVLAIGYLATMARVGELERESHRLDALIANEIACQHELARGRAAECNAATLERFALTQNMVKAPVRGERVVVGVLPAPEPILPGGLVAARPASSGTPLPAGLPSPARAGIIAYDLALHFPR
jgi:hypothetical protein